MSSHGKPVALVIGASRGIGRQVAVDLAKNGYYVVVSAKSLSSQPAHLIPASEFPPDPNSSKSTINTVAREITELGGHALALQVDVRDPEAIQVLIDEVLKRLGSIDALVYNSGAIWWSSVEGTPWKRFRLMQQINPEGLYATVQALLPHIKAKTRPSSSSGSGFKSKGTRIIVVCPPIYARFVRGKTAYAMGKIGMSVLVKGLAVDFTRQGLVTPSSANNDTSSAITGIWPAVAIESAATEFNVPVDADAAQQRKADLRKPTVYSDAILAMLRAPAETVNGLLDTDEDFLRRVEGLSEKDFERYDIVPRAKTGGRGPRRIMPKVFPDLRVEEEDDEGNRMDSAVNAAAKDKQGTKSKL